MAEDKKEQSLIEKALSWGAKQLASGTAASAHKQLSENRNAIDEVAKVLEEGDDPNRAIFEKDPFQGENF
jgi:hypothetical protein